MQAYEFNAVVRDGLIHIPKQLSDKQLSNVRVIILSNSVKKVFSPREKKFSAMRLKTKGLIFDREELLER